MEKTTGPHDLTLRETAEGIAVRAGVLTVVTLIVGTWLFSLAAKAAGGLVKIISGTLLLAIAAAVGTWEVKKFRKRFNSPDSSRPALP